LIEKGDLNTENSVIQQELQEVQGQAGSEQSLLQKDDFITLISYEMRTPLTVIIGALATLSQDGDRLPEDDRRQLMDDAIAESAELSNILDDLLELSHSRIDRHVVLGSSVLMNDIVNKAVTRFAKISSHRIVLDMPIDFPPVEADPRKVERVIYNLLRNAAKCSHADQEIKIRAARHHSSILVTVGDKGESLADMEMDALFNPIPLNVQTEKCYDCGIILGLEVCRRLVESQGGRFWLKSTQGQDAIRCFTLPFKNQALESTPGL
jgi:K+-sensing histidine kinase KdpD